MEEPTGLSMETSTGLAGLLHVPPCGNPHGKGSDTYLLAEALIEKLTKAAMKGILDNQMLWLLSANLVYAVDNVITVRHGAVRQTTSELSMKTKGQFGLQTDLEKELLKTPRKVSLKLQTI